MSDSKFTIDIYKTKTIDEITRLISDPACKAEEGSFSAISASMAASLLSRAAAIISSCVSNDRIKYIAKNSEILRSYMIHLIDEDVKSRGPLRKAIKDGGQYEREACLRPACAINSELLSIWGISAWSWQLSL